MQTISVILAFLLTALIITTRRQTSTGHEDLQKRIVEMDTNLQRLIGLVQATQNQRSYYSGLVLENGHMREKLVERYQSLQRMIAELERQITARGGKNFAPPHLLTQLDEYKDEMRLIEKKLDDGNGQN